MRKMRFIARYQSRLIGAFFNLLYPSDCPVCGQAPDDFLYAPLCTACWKGIQKYSGPSCAICSNPFSSEYGSLCAACMNKRPYFIRAASFGLYDNNLAIAINLFKFHGIKRLARPLSSLLLDHDMDGIDALVPVPLSIRSLRKRGFNQSLLLAHTIARRKRVRIIADGLIKTTETPPQLGLSSKQRLKNIRGAFRSAKEFSGMRVLLIDDVMTTGATVNECSLQLLTAGAEEVSVLTLARSSML